MEPTTGMQFNQVAEITISYSSTVKARDRPIIKSSGDAYRLLLQSWDKNVIELIEQFKVLLLNRANHVLGIYTASTGGLTGTVADLRLIFAAALKSGATAIMIAHNHPSGGIMPSVSDKACTSNIALAGKLFEIKLMDHLIISLDGYYSFADEGEL
jgi:DNA repair protein RadC